MTGDQIRDAIAAALEPLRDDVRRLAHTIEGNGHPGIKGRIVRLETVVSVIASVILFSAGIASCGISSGYIAIPTRTSR